MQNPTRSLLARIIVGQPFTFDARYSLDKCLARIEERHEWPSDMKSHGKILSRHGDRVRFKYECFPTDSDSAIPLAQAIVRGTISSIGDQVRVTGNVQITLGIRLFMLIFMIIWVPLWMALATQNGSLLFAGVALVIFPIAFLMLREADRIAQRLYTTLRNRL